MACRNATKDAIARAVPSSRRQGPELALDRAERGDAGDVPRPWCSAPLCGAFGGSELPLDLAELTELERLALGGPELPERALDLAELAPIGRGLRFLYTAPR